MTPNEERFFRSCDSDTIQAAIEGACAEGTRVLYIPRYNLRTDCDEWRISSSIKIPDNFTLYLDNCFMVMETGVFDAMFTNSNRYDPDVILKAENEQKNIAIIGLGNVCLDGGKHNRLLEKTKGKNGLPRAGMNDMFSWLNVNGLRIENIHIQNHRRWAMVHYYCCNVTIKNIDFYAIPHVYNQDGIDLRSGNHHFTIENLTGRTGDDTLALSAIADASETVYKVEGKSPDLHDITIRDIQSDPFTFYNLRLMNHDGRKLYNIDADTLMDTSDYATKVLSGGALSVGSPLYYHISPAKPGDTYNIKVRNITSRSTNTIVLNHTVHDTLISNVKTYGDNINGITGWFRFPDPTEFENVTVEHFFYDPTMQERVTSKALDKSRFYGTFLNLPNANGKLKLKDIHIGDSRDRFVLGGGVTVEAEEVEEYGETVNRLTCDGISRLTIDGEEQNNG